MKKIFVNTLESKMSLDGVQFALVKYQENMTKNGDKYLRLEVGDKTGVIVGNVWNDSLRNVDLDGVKPGDIIKVYGKVDEYKGKLQLHFLSIGKATDYDLADFIQMTDKDPDDLWTKLLAQIDTISDTDIRQLFENVQQEQNFIDSFKTHPAALKIHHAFKHGLLEHTMEMLDLSDVMYKYYPMVDMSIVKAAVILHDIGKLLEIKDEGTTFSKTLEGKLIGHITQGYEYLLKLLPEDFPYEKAVKLKHAILAHHGILEYGSPVVPQTIEAAMVNGLDVLSSQVRQYERIIRANKDSEAEFSPFDGILRREIYLK